MWFAFHCFDKHHKFPSEYAALCPRERAMVKAFIQVRIEHDKKNMKK